MLTPEFKKVKFLSFILLYVGLTEFCIQCMRIALLLFFHLLQISRKAVTCMYAYRELGDIWFIQIPLHVISHPNLDTFSSGTFRVDVLEKKETYAVFYQVLLITCLSLTAVSC